MSLALIVAGQSNALGYKVTVDELPESYAPNPNAVIWNAQALRWDMMVPGVNTGTPANPGAWGPEVAFAASWTRDHPGEVLYVVKVVKGETGLAQSEGLDWSPESRGELFDTLAAQVAASHIGNATVLWAQGETDAYDLDNALAYGARLDALKDAARDAWQVHTWLTAESRGPYALDQGDNVIGISGVSFQDDGIHYDGAGQLLLGDLFYDKWAGLL